MRIEGLPEQAFAEALTFSDELRVLPAVDRPNTVQTLTGVARLGGWDRIWPPAVANLRRRPVPGHQRVQEGAATVHVLVSEDLFGASRVLDLDAVLDCALGTSTAPRHVLVAVPNRQVLLGTVLSGPEVAPAVGVLARIAAQQAQRAGGLSANLFYRAPDATVQQISRPGPDGGTQVHVTGAFAEALQRLGLIDQG